MIRGLSASGLEDIIEKEREKDYLIIDVRQPEEYRLDHIPGSLNIPLAEIRFDPFSFEDNRKLIFYCTRGSRSKVAAVFVSEAGYDEDNLFHLENGLFEYTGEVLLSMPRVDLFPEDVSTVSLMKKAIDLEKGAFLFYQSARDKLAGTDISETIKAVGQDEIAHAKAIFNRIKTLETISTDFYDFFDKCRGEVLEGGRPLSDVEAFLQSESSNPCLDILDFAVELEYHAYDLYKSMAENADDPHIKSMFFTLAQAEKKHLDQIVKALEQCA